MSFVSRGSLKFECLDDLGRQFFVVRSTGGSVGIGTSSPRLELDTPDISITGDIYKNNKLYKTSQWGIIEDDIGYTRGMIGIGTTNPMYSLEVDGSIRVEDKILLGNFVSLSGTKITSATNFIKQPLPGLINISNAESFNSVMNITIKLPNEYGNYEYYYQALIELYGTNSYNDWKISQTSIGDLEILDAIEIRVTNGNTVICSTDIDNLTGISIISNVKSINLQKAVIPPVSLTNYIIVGGSGNNTPTLARYNGFSWNYILSDNISRTFSDVALSGNGQYQLGIWNSGTSGGYLKSDNYGVSWETQGNLVISQNNTRNFCSISNDGQKQIISTSLRLFYSDSYGINWTSTVANTLSDWEQVKLSGNGEFIYAYSTYKIYKIPTSNLTSITEIYDIRTLLYGGSGLGLNIQFQDMDVSYRGDTFTFVIMVSGFYGYYRVDIVSSTDYGVNWHINSQFQSSTNPSNQNFSPRYVSLSFTGEYQYIIVNHVEIFPLPVDYTHYIYQSRDYGKNWDLVGINPENANSLSVSGDAQVIITSVENGPCYISYDFGKNWSIFSGISYPRATAICSNYYASIVKQNFESPVGQKINLVETDSKLEFDNKWKMTQQTNGNLDFSYNGVSKGYISSETDVGSIDFTGQHRCIIQGELLSQPGFIVRSSGRYSNFDKSVIPSINESLPVVQLTKSARDPCVFGVISSVSSGSFKIGNYVTYLPNDENRVVINSVGEGGIWVCDENGLIKNGDLLCSSSLPGIAMRQDSPFICNYTVAKATCDAFFDNKNVAFIGCTYHCG